MYFSDELSIPFELKDKDHSSIFSETDPDSTNLATIVIIFLQSKFNTLTQESNIASGVFFFSMSHQYS